MQRPTGVTILSVLAFIGAVCLVLAALGLFLGGALLSSLGGRQGLGILAGVGGALVGAVFLVIAAVEFVLGMGLWKLQNWARIVTIVFLCLGAIFNATSLLGSVMHFRVLAMFLEAVVIAIDIWIVVYLMKPRVREAFSGIQPQRPAQREMSASGS